MTRRKAKPYARRRIVRFAINFRGFPFDFCGTATLITAGHIAVRDERLIFRTFSASGRATATISLVIALVIRMASALAL